MKENIRLISSWLHPLTRCNFATETDEKSIPGKPLSEGFYELINKSNNI